jgi:tetrahydromethanopterin S-methyltransferase subunit A
MLKVKPVEGYPPEKGRYVRGNDYSPVAVCTILDTFDFAIPQDLNELVLAGIDAGAAIAGLLQTENIGMEKMICNIVANPNIRYIVLCGRESTGHLPGESLLSLMQNGVGEDMHIIGSKALTPVLANIPVSIIERFRSQIVTIVNLLCMPGSRDTNMPGLNPKTVEQAVRSCYQEEPVKFMDYSLHDVGAYPEQGICHKIIAKITSPPPTGEPGKTAMNLGFTLHKLLPRTDCGKCGKRNCLAFAIDLAKGKSTLEQCPVLEQPEFIVDRQSLDKLVNQR